MDPTTDHTFEKLRDTILDIAKHIKSNDETFKISTMPNSRNTFKNLLNTYQKAYTEVEASTKVYKKMTAEFEKLENSEPTEYIDTSAYEKEYNKQIKVEQKKVDKSRFTDAQKALARILKQEDEEIVVEAPAQQILKDPITKKDIETPVKSLKCGHTYDKQSIEGYIGHLEAAGKTNIRCPVAGCVNKSLKLSDIVEANF